MNFINKARSQLGLFKEFIVMPRMGWKLRKPSRKVTIYEQERRAQKQLEKEYRAKVISDYWNSQTILENEYIEKYTREELERKKKSDQNFRDSIIRIAKATQNHVEFLKKRSALDEAKERKHILEQDVKAMNKKRILNIMQQESRHWINQQNVNNINPDSIMPATIYDETDYYLKLHEQAFLFEQGRLEEMEKVSLETEEIQYKNSVLMPIYQDVISMIKHLKSTESFKLEKEFQAAKRILIEDCRNMQIEDQLEEKMAKLEKAFNTLRKAQKEKFDQPENQLEFLHEHLLILYNMLRKWGEYTNMLKIPATVVRDILHERQVMLEKKKLIRKQNLEQAKNQDRDTEENEQDSDIQSNDERETSDSEDEIDIAKLIEEEKLRQEKIKEQQRLFEERKLQMEKEQAEEEQAEQKQTIQDDLLNPEKAIENLMLQFEKKAEEELNAEFHIEKNSLYGNDKNAVDSRDFYKGIDLENVFPRALIDNSFDFTKLSGLPFQNVKEALRNEEKIELLRGEDPNNSPRKFETALIVEVFKLKSQQLRAASLTRAQQQKLNDIDTLLDLIGEIKVEEPTFLLKIWKNF
ncbi:hypothetical protein TTHERM_00561490 (macronuclear) [Tetrahymena thermophila SB210]|uniref:Uncharacterized protein n=1 Tax=Tetrahymena thermophila (strain SB210) TaxID=312017 RepID=I7M0P0_TETTS|nr:hypothetical protein TTHERM_00561490 [Tetrahymena thermophila SB210]EAR89958.2 hypothetical protein TTHERM_00561490 [Tetrahymena thermophila SB210]6Z1P_Bv Chain Bv, mS26 [Tetrahymena thermophila SB210]|eukprot:XP_001010203.2 hypothetical protein TTHERM_00561490 [Tetrahymena thermophila SB210]